MFFINLLETNLKTKIIGKKIEYYPFTDSTNDDIWELTEDEPINGIVVVTDNQKNGRGQRGKKWFSRAGHSITCSFMVTDKTEYSKLLSILVPIGINSGIKNLLNLETDIKWPNDIYFKNKKLGGILIESKITSETNNYAIGIGLNVNEVEDDFNSNFDEKVDGHRIRKKFRFRYYEKNLENQGIYLETKGRNLERTYKRRIKIDESDIELIKQNKFLYKLIKKYPNSQTINEFVFESYRKNLKPKVIIDYMRRPYVNKHGLYFRLTFDQNISCINLNNNLKNSYLNQNISCKTGYTILEVKFDRSIPLWFHRIIQSYNLRRQSISKFVLGMCYSRLGSETSD